MSSPLRVPVTALPASPGPPVPPAPTAAPAVLLAPPAAERRPRILELHGDRLVDDYHWLRNRDNPAVRAYLEAENAYAEAVLAPTKPLQEQLYQEMLSRIKQTDLSVPYREGEFWYYTRTEEGKQYPIHCRKRGMLNAGEEVLLDLNLLAEGRSYLAVGVLGISPDGRLLAYSLDVTGSREYTLWVKDLETQALVAGPLEHAGSMAWAV